MMDIQPGFWLDLAYSPLFSYTVAAFVFVLLTLFALWLKDHMTSTVMYPHISGGMVLKKEWGFSPQKKDKDTIIRETQVRLVETVFAGRELFPEQVDTSWSQDHFSCNLVDGERRLASVDILSEMKGSKKFVNDIQIKALETSWSVISLASDEDRVVMGDGESCLLLWRGGPVPVQEFVADMSTDQLWDWIAAIHGHKLSI